MLLTGTFNRLVDEKQRIVIPKRLMESIRCQPKGVLYVAPGTDQSISIYTEEAFSGLGERLSQVSPPRQDVRAFLRLFYGQAQRVELDRQGRLRIPADLARIAGIDKEVVLLGVQNHLEVWAPERWRRYISEKQTQYDEIAEKAMEMRN